ncbi:TonB-dependent receptor [Mongoliitalea daihaiensis]|uniref:TonB-dependent receptor n=1 Tax=Mongoliitalea daihaiensis TaxID=2782006 RepID=UPI001F1819A4|nr:TonB-dependent receptor [Mongoliitalea daihaiensis]UJP66572.1 outer membrane beta-barrel protein [Mongoliitalea daihaiensis]
MKIYYYFLLVMVMISSDLFAAKINGKIRDTSSQELLIGANVSIVHESSKKVFRAVSGLDGTFSFNAIPSGKYLIEITYIGYALLSDTFELQSENSSLSKDFALASDDSLLSEFVITAGVQGTDVQARQLERNSASVLNIISARQIQLSPDITVANVIQRVSGLSIERNASGDPQYAIVRGMDKRYNNTLVNGIKIPSPDNENRFVPLDIFPAVLLERLEVFKSLTANMEADAIGGTVNMIMKSAPNRLMLEGDFQLGYNQLNLDRKFQTYDRSNLSKRSPKERFGDTYRATPDDFPVENMINEGITPLPDIFANLTFGNRYFNNKLGVMLGGSYQNSYRPVSNYFYDPGVSFLEGNPLLMRELIERETSSQLQRAAVHGKFDYAINNSNTISLYLGHYILNEFRVRDQVRRESFVASTDYAVYPITRFSNILQSISTADLRGEHKLTSQLKANWMAIFSTALNDRPDDGVFSRAGQFLASENRITNESVYFQGTRNSRAWERNRDTDISLYMDFKFTPYFINEKTEILFGGVGRNKVRDNFFNFYNYAQIFGQFRGVDWDDFGEVNFRAMANPLGSGDRSNLVYDAYENIYAGYINASITLNRTNFQGGLRAEQTFQGYEINATAAAGNDTELKKEQQYLSLFPSASVKHSVNDKTNLRATYFKGISRPGFYEIVPTIRSAGGGDSFYSERGNENLRPSFGHSADLRYEFFPSGADQILFGFFYKRIIDPIEFGFPQPEGADALPNTSRILPQNFDDATNIGIEADYTKYFSKLGIRFNYTYTNSEITTTKVVVNQDRSNSIVNQTRPLQGQSDHIANLSLLYKDQKNMLDIQLVGNYTGERIAFVSPFYEADHYMKPMTQLDFSLDKGFKSGVVAFLKINNILNTPYQLYVKKPLAVPTDPYPFQTDPFNIGFVRRDLFGQSIRLGLRYTL